VVRAIVGSAQVASPRKNKFYCPCYGDGTKPATPSSFSVAPVIT